MCTYTSFLFWRESKRGVRALISNSFLACFGFGNLFVGLPLPLERFSWSLPQNVTFGPEQVLLLFSRHLHGSHCPRTLPRPIYPVQSEN